MCPGLLPVVSRSITVKGEKCDGGAGTQPCAMSPFLRLTSPSPPLSSSPSSSILIAPWLAKSETPSCEGLSLFFSRPRERQQAASKSVPGVTSVEEAVRAGGRAQTRAAAALGCLPGQGCYSLPRERVSILPSALRESAQPEVAGLSPPAAGLKVRGERVVSSIRPPFFILSLGSCPFLICRRGLELNIPFPLHL